MVWVPGNDISSWTSWTFTAAFLELKKKIVQLLERCQVRVILEQTAGRPVVEQPAAGGVGKMIGKTKAPSFYTTAFDEYLEMCFRGEVAQIFRRDSTSFQFKKTSWHYLVFQHTKWTLLSCRFRCYPGCTLPTTNIAPENRPLEKEIPIGNHCFFGAMLVLGRVKSLDKGWYIDSSRVVCFQQFWMNTVDIKKHPF